MPPLELVTDHAGAAADIPFGDWTRTGSVQRGEHVLLLDMKTGQIIQIAVISLRDDREAHLSFLIAQFAFKLPLDQRVSDRSHAVGVRNAYRAFEVTGLLHPRRAGHLSVAVQDGTGGENRLVFPASRKKCRHPGAHRSFSGNKPAIPGDDGGVTHFNAVNIGDRVEGSWFPVKRDSKIAGSQPDFISVRPDTAWAVGHPGRISCVA